MCSDRCKKRQGKHFAFWGSGQDDAFVRIFVLSVAERGECLLNSVGQPQRCARGDPVASRERSNVVETALALGSEGGPVEPGHVGSPSSPQGDEKAAESFDAVMLQAEAEEAIHVSSV